MNESNRASESNQQPSVQSQEPNVITFNSRLKNQPPI